MCVVGGRRRGGGEETEVDASKYSTCCVLNAGAQYLLRLALSSEFPEQKFETNTPGTFHPGCILFVERSPLYL